MAEAKKQSINAVTAGLMVTTAIVFDLLSLIPVVNLIVAPTAWLIFGLWFLLQGVGIFSARRLAAMGSSLVLEMMPLLSFLPGITVGVLGIILMVKSEQRLGLKAALLPK